MVNLIESPSLTSPGPPATARCSSAPASAPRRHQHRRPVPGRRMAPAERRERSADTTQSYLQQIQTALNEPSTTGINSQLSTFWSDWNDLADNPNNAAAQQAVVHQGEEVATVVQLAEHRAQRCRSDRSDRPGQRPSILGQVNSQYMATMEGPTAAGASGGTLYNDAYNISSLNYSIVQAQAAGQSAERPDRSAQRGASTTSRRSATRQVQNNTDGSVTVYFGGVTGTALVNDPVGIPPGGAVPPATTSAATAPAAPPPALAGPAAWQSAVLERGRQRARRRLRWPTRSAARSAR